MLNSRGKKLVGSVLGLALLIGGAFAIVNSQNVEAQETGSVSMNFSFSEIKELVSMFLGKDTPTESVGAVSSPDVYSYMNVHGPFSQGGGLSTITPTSSAHTITFAQMNDYNVITFSASTTMPALTATLPATTTFPIGTKAGSYRSWVIENPFTAAATTTTIAAGTGVDLQEPDGQNVVIGINNYAWLTCFRMANTDVTCSVDETIPAD